MLVIAGWGGGCSGGCVGGGCVDGGCGDGGDDGCRGGGRCGVGIGVVVGYGCMSLYNNLLDPPIP